VIDLAPAAFADCTSLTGITIPNGVTRPARELFSGCMNLASVTIRHGVNSIGRQAFAACASLTGLAMPSSVIGIGASAFSSCSRLRGAYLEGNAPGLGAGVFDGADVVTVYYLRGATGWGTTFGGRPTALGRPWIQSDAASLGVRMNQFGFSTTWANGRILVVEACTDLGQSTWSPAATNTLTNGAAYFGDPEWTNYAGRFYRVRSP
jgi:hypothetical protein